MSTTSPHAAGFNGRVVREIKAEAARRDLTDAALAEAVGMHPTVLSRYLNYKRAMKIETAERIAEALGVSPADLVTRAYEQRDG